MKLPRRLTLTERTDFQAVRENGQSHGGRFLVLACLPKPAQAEWRYALITSKKAGKAHERNQIRRLIRAVLSEEGAQITGGHDLVFIARWRAKEASYHDIKREVQKLLAKLNLLQGEAKS